MAAAMSRRDDNPEPREVALIQTAELPALIPALMAVECSLASLVSGRTVRGCSLGAKATYSLQIYLQALELLR
jgi:hypothetical protein